MNKKKGVEACARNNKRDNRMYKHTSWNSLYDNKQRKE